MSDKLQNLVGQLERAVARFSDALAQETNDYIRDTAIQRFEFTFELAWKTLKVLLEEKGLTTYAPRDSIKGAFQVGLIPDNPTWLEMIKLRNLTSHTYNEGTAKEIFDALPRILVLFNELLAELKAVD